MLPRRLATALFVLAVPGVGLPQTDTGPESFLPLRYDEDYSYLADSAQRDTRWKALKYIPAGEGRYLSIGGEARARFEAYRNENFTRDPVGDNEYLMQRYLLHLDAHPAPRFRLFGQAQWSLEDGRDAGPRPTDRNGPDIHQLFVDVAASDGQVRSLL